MLITWLNSRTIIMMMHMVRSVDDSVFDTARSYVYSVLMFLLWQLHHFRLQYFIWIEINRNWLKAEIEIINNYHVLTRWNHKCIFIYIYLKLVEIQIGIKNVSILYSIELNELSYLFGVYCVCKWRQSLKHPCSHTDTYEECGFREDIVSSNSLLLLLLIAPLQ